MHVDMHILSSVASYKYKHYKYFTNESLVHILIVVPKIIYIYTKT